MRPLPVVSVVIPAYRPGWLDDAIESVREQSFTSWELIVVDDGSPEPVQPARTSDVVMIRHRNAGPGGARNRGVEHARGELVAFLDADDRWHPHKLARQVARHRAEPDLVMTCTDLAYVGHTAGAPRPRTVREHGRFAGTRLPYDRLFHENPVATSTVVVKRRTYVRAGGMPANRRMGEDFVAWLRIGRLGPIGYLPQPLLERRRHDASLMAETRRDGSWLPLERQLYADILRELPELHDARFVRRALGRLEFQGGWCHLERREWSEARRALLRSLRLDPLRPKAWFDLARAVLHVGPRPCG